MKKFKNLIYSMIANLLTFFVIFIVPICLFFVITSIILVYLTFFTKFINSVVWLHGSLLLAIFVPFWAIYIFYQLKLTIRRYSDVYLILAIFYLALLLNFIYYFIICIYFTDIIHFKFADYNYLFFVLIPLWLILVILIEDLAKKLYIQQTLIVQNYLENNFVHKYQIIDKLSIICAILFIIRCLINYFLIYLLLNILLIDLLYYVFFILLLCIGIVHYFRMYLYFKD